LPVAYKQLEWMLGAALHKTGKNNHFNPIWAGNITERQVGPAISNLYRASLFIKK
jgi:hypothetical protein